MIPFLITLIYSQLFFAMTNVQEFDTKWDEILLSMTKIPPDDILESLYKLRIRESDQLKTVLELYDMEIHQKISMSEYQRMKTMVKRRTRSETSHYETLTLELRELKQEQWLRIAGVNVVLKEDKENAMNGKQKDSVRECSFQHDENKRANRQ